MEFFSILKSTRNMNPTCLQKEKNNQKKVTTKRDIRFLCSCKLVITHIVLVASMVELLTPQTLVLKSEFFFFLD